MGYIIIDEEKLEDNLRIWNSEDYYGKAMRDVVNARVDYSHMLAALQQEEERIDKDIKELELRKGDIAVLMKYAK